MFPDLFHNWAIIFGDTFVYYAYDLVSHTARLGKHGCVALSNAIVGCPYIMHILSGAS